MTLQLVQPIAETNKKNQLHISYSQLNTYLLCPQKYAHTYVWGSPMEQKPMALVFGRAIHKASERFNRYFKDTDRFLDVQELIKTFKAVYDHEIGASEVDISLKNGETIESTKAMGIELIKLFHASIRPQQILAVEFPFSVSVPDLENGGYLPIRLYGYFDLVESDDEGNYLICELKTSSQRYSSLKLQYDLQPTVYSFAMSRMNLATSKQSCLVRYDVLLKTKKPALESYFVTRGSKEHEQLVHLINQVLRAIESRIFYRNLGWLCQDCQFKKACLD